MKIIFMGTPNFSVKVLDYLIKNHEVLLVVTQPDKRVGRKKIIEFSPVKKKALENNIGVFQPLRIRKDYQRIIDCKADMVITAAYGQIIPEIVLVSHKFHAINVHASLLPKYRGGAPIHKSIINGEKETGVSIMYMIKKMDAGDILLQRSIPIEHKDNVLTMFDKLAVLGVELLTEILPLIETNNVSPVKQVEKDVTFAYNITREEELITFNKTSVEVYNQVRGLNSWPVGYLLLDGLSVKIFEVEILKETYNGNVSEIISENDFIIKTLDGAVRVLDLQVQSKKRMKVKDFLNGQGKNIIKMGLQVNQERG